MSTLILVEHDNQKLHPSIQNVLNAALQLDSEPVLLVAGYHCEQVAAQASKLKGVHSVLLANEACYEFQLAENISQLVVALAEPYTAIIAASNTFGKNILPRVAAMLEVGQVSDVTKIIKSRTVEHPIYAGNAIEKVKILDDKAVMTIRTTAFAAITEEQNACSIEKIEQSFETSQVTFVNHQINKSVRPELGNASIIVSGGRGLQNAEKFKLIEELADALGAAVGASRAAVDAGFVSNEYQVGQTGKVVAPILYFAIGISGAVQHLAGMKDSKVIVAINKDPEAPIFQIATYGLVGDLFTIVPQLIEQLTKE